MSSASPGPGLDGVIAHGIEAIGEVGLARTIRARVSAWVCDSSPIDKQFDELAIVGDGAKMLKTNFCGTSRPP